MYSHGNLAGWHGDSSESSRQNNSTKQRFIRGNSEIPACNFVFEGLTLNKKSLFKSFFL